ncbi:flagellar protein export ATPase FliI [Ponticaulis sp.]|uniref:flagellar protein export ATPase FliI n=1 Tax=Ponticaulis sp. TaxID=2020902 RepID=UPI000B626845|nr:flagellar protein export ATPase FliI [Ponticaulis sp.]MAI90515.1 flagellum-specific ATP synthase FliI [Ponticaulis sp.]OUY00209.1 MAG: flagellum-specific ATP synthase FliI [Hyphomonadaceae bacterium TMED5]|tara:strand:+ start:143690 stop:145006 length:1317 start_codon:yes stop_codon:yes gene_type:complete
MLQDLIREVKRAPVVQMSGRVEALEGLRIEASGPRSALRLGALAHIGDPHGPLAEIVGFRGDLAILLACEDSHAVYPGAKVFFQSEPSVLYPSEHWLGRVVDPFGKPMDGGPVLPRGSYAKPVDAPPPSAHMRTRIEERLHLGVRVMDLFTPCGRGQRLGLFAGSGVGKSTLMGMLAKGADADVIVIGLVGERGREVREFVEDALGADGLARSVIVTATSDAPAPARKRAAMSAMAVAEYFRDTGKQVLCLLDSVTRFAMAQREIGLAAGEPPTTRGYTPSVFAELPKLLERAGPGPKGTGAITGLFTVLVDGDDHNEPVADAVRGILDGHIVMSRQIGERGRYPAVDVLKSLSRLASQLQAPEEAELVTNVRRLVATYTDMEELIRIGAYAPGADKQTDRAIRLNEGLDEFLTQSYSDPTAPDAVFDALRQIYEASA